jgi:hypothetical protein
MKVGTLVELSAAGRKLKWMWLYHGKLGIVLEDMYREDNLYIAFTNSNVKGTPKVLMSNGDVHRFTKESLQVLSPAIGAVPMGGAVPHRRANSSENFPVE